MRPLIFSEALDFSLPSLLVNTALQIAAKKSQEAEPRIPMKHSKLKHFPRETMERMTSNSRTNEYL